MPLLYHKTVYYVLALLVYYVTTLYSLLPPRIRASATMFVGEGITLPHAMGARKRPCHPERSKQLSIVCGVEPDHREGAR